MLDCYIHSYPSPSSFSLFHPLSFLLLVLRLLTLLPPCSRRPSQTMSRHSRNLPALPLILPHPPPISGFRHPLQAVQVSSITGYSRIRPSSPRNTRPILPYSESRPSAFGLGGNNRVIEARSLSIRERWRGRERER